MVELKNFINYLKDVTQKKRNSFNKDFFYFLFDKKNSKHQIKMNIDTKCLVLSHYPSAETRGLGGLIAQYPKNFEVLCFTNGVCESVCNINKKENENNCENNCEKNCENGSEAKKITQNIQSQFKQSFLDIMKMTRVKGYKIFDINKKTLKDCYQTFRKIDISEADYIFIPNVYDKDEDAIALLRHFCKLLKEKEHKKNLKIFMYECDFCLCTTDYCVNIAPIIETKKRMLLKYYENNIELVNKLIGLNSFRSINSGFNYCEVFMSFSVNEFLNIPML